MAYELIFGWSNLQGPKQMKKLKPRVPGGKKKKAAKKARKAVGSAGAHTLYYTTAASMLQLLCQGAGPQHSVGVCPRIAANASILI